MDRQIVYPGSIPLDTDLLSIQRNVMVAIGYLSQAVLGQTTVADGLTCTPSQPPSMAVSVGVGCLTQFGALDTNSFGSLPALPNVPLVRTGVNVSSTTFSLSSPLASGQTITYLIQASLLEADANPVILPYYNAANPGQPYSGPLNSGSPQMTQRLQSVQLQLKAGPAIATGTLGLPSVDAGWVGLYLIAVNSSQSVISAASIAVMPGAPFLRWKLPQLSPGTHNLSVFQPTTQGGWTVPSGVTAVKLRVWGGGGAGGSGFGGAGGGGAAGGYSEGFYPVSAGQSFIISVGNGGAGSSGGNSSFGSLASATGGQAGANGGAATGGTGALGVGVGYGSGLQIAGSSGADPFGGGSAWQSGAGGTAHGSAGGQPVVGSGTASIPGRNASGPGGGGSGGVGSGLGGQGGTGLVLVEW